MSASTIDPRIRARRIAVQRDEGRKRLRRLAVVAGVAATVTAGWGVTRTPLLDVDHIVVTGAGQSGVGAVQQAVGIERGDTLLSAPLARAAARVADLPWVETVDVSRQWPNRIRVQVVERTPTAAVPAQADGWVLLDASGRQLAVVPEPGPGVVRVEVPPVTAAPGRPIEIAAAAVLDLAATRPEALADRLVALRPTGKGAVEGTVRLADGSLATVRFGRPTQAASKWLALVTVLDDADPAGVRTIDVRVPSAPALTRR